MRARRRFPAAALAARGWLQAGARRGRWLAAASLSTILVAAAVALPSVRRVVAAEGFGALAVGAAAALLAGVWGAWVLRRRATAALACLVAGWGVFYAGLALIYPRTPTARELHELARSAARAARDSGASVVCYRTYLQTFPWELQSILPVVEYRGEFEPWFLPEARRREIFWSGEDFRGAWSSRPIVALTRLRDRGDFPAGTKVIDSRGKYCLVTNVK
jgi:hypothetical protein